MSEHTLRFIEPIINDTYHLSVITKMELLGFAFSDADKFLDTQSFVNDGVVIALSEIIVEQTIILRQQYRIKLPDAIIAASAIVFDFILISRNDKDFEKIEGLKYVNPF